MAAANYVGAGLAAIGLTGVNLKLLLEKLLSLRSLEFGHYVSFSKLLCEFNIRTAFINAVLEDLSDAHSLIFLRLTLPTLDWRFDFKFDIKKWSLLIIWFVNGHKWVMKLTMHWMGPSRSALLVYQVMKACALLSLKANLFSDLLYYISLVDRINDAFCTPFMVLSNFMTASRSFSTSGWSGVNAGSEGPSGKDNKDSNDKDDDKVSKQTKYQREQRKAMNAPDNGQVTTNPYILAKRHMSSVEPVDLVLLNSILAFHNISITAEHFDFIKSLVPVSLPYPLPAADADIIAVIGKANKASSNVAGAYVLTFLADGRQYVGGSKDLAKRVRYYYGSKGLLETRDIARLMATHGVSAFKLQVYVLPSNMIATSDTSTANLVLALEQYLILLLKPTLNGVLVVGGVSDNMGGSLALAAVAAKKMKPVYVYNTDRTELRFISKSRADLVKEMGVHQTTVNRRLTDGEAFLQTYVLSDELDSWAVESLMTADELRESVAALYKNRMTIRDYSSKVASNMHSVYLTDTTLKDAKRKFFVSKSQAQQYTAKFAGRSIYIKQFNKGLPFQLHGWLVESASS